MATHPIPYPPAEPAETRAAPNGAAHAAFLAAGIGTFAMGVIVVLYETDVFAPPVIYAPAGGVSGRTTLAVIVWLIAWAVLHARWRHRDLATGRIATLTFVFIALGFLLAFPPLWPVFGA